VSTLNKFDTFVRSAFGRFSGIENRLRTFLNLHFDPSNLLSHLLFIKKYLFEPQNYSWNWFKKHPGNGVNFEQIWHPYLKYVLMSTLVQETFGES